MRVAGPVACGVGAAFVALTASELISLDLLVLGIAGAGVVFQQVPWLVDLVRWVGAAFLKGYLAGADGAPFLPADAVQRAAVLDLYLVDKALYELNYELNNRPDWVRIPVRGLADLSHDTRTA